MDPEKILAEGSLASLQEAFLSRQISVREAVAFYLDRIASYDRSGPGFNAVRTLAPGALESARIADEELSAGKSRGPLHGIPVLLKDNILSADGMAASAGAAALAGFVPRREAALVKRLRQCGAIILGKTNMTEFADYVSDVMPSGFSGAGGVVRNPHTGAYGRGQGSSVGSAAAVAAGFAPVAIGSETQNSIQTPASVTSVFGFKPSVGAISCAGVVPLVPSQDSPGPLARCAEDAALVTRVLAGPGVLAADVPPLRQLRIGVPRRTIADRPELSQVMPAFEGALSKLSAGGAVIVDPCDLPSAEQLQDVRSSVFRTEFKAALNAFLEENDSPCGIASLEALIAWNENHPDAVPYGQSLLLAAQGTRGLSDPLYQLDRRRDIILSGVAGIDAALSLGVDFLIAPMGALAKCTGKAGAPVLAIPIGRDAAGDPCGVTLCGAVGQDAALLAAGTAVAKVIGERCFPALGAR